MSAEFAERLLPRLPDLVADYGTPFHVYDARGIVATHEAMTRAFGDTSYRQYFAVKALPNLNILALLRAAGSGFDCSSAVEVRLAGTAGAQAGDIVFTSNNTTLSEYRAARAAGALITFDDRSFAEKVDELPETVAFRISPTGLAAGCALMGDAAHSKFGVPVRELAGAYADAVARGARRFGIHGMTCANELDTGRAARAAADVIRHGARVAEAVGIELEYVNVGGGLGIPYHEDDKPIDFTAYADEILATREELFGPGGPRILTEIGRYVTGPHGVLVTRVINRCRKGHEIVGLDASMSSLMRPAMYGAYHHISLPFAEGRELGRFDVVGALCENLDKFAIDRELPEPRDGDIALIHDTGAHGHAMGFTYNGRLRPAELMLTDGGDVVEIRRAETYDDYIATVRWGV
ncbi:diaminopimelate decarboxylase [Nonomuraea angiospora]|uniref:diaminopimelate decarboxylase n=1 Tax=Nonomuraea angiospora TaxID=46172 RepID=UPI0029A28C49|nr:diaminopimelate decarboxylase [Nonomuraea angiospora]MDX3105781.1 diaminopimelate decarboxylase [Nonomuraea angiospora]